MAAHLFPDPGIRRRHRPPVFRNRTLIVQRRGPYRREDVAALIGARRLHRCALHLVGKCAAGDPGSASGEGRPVIAEQYRRNGRSLVRNGVNGLTVSSRRSTPARSAPCGRSSKSRRFCANCQAEPFDLMTSTRQPGVTSLFSISSRFRPHKEDPWPSRRKLDTPPSRMMAPSPSTRSRRCHRWRTPVRLGARSRCPGQRLKVRVLLDGAPVAEAIVDRNRPDLKRERDR